MSADDVLREAMQSHAQEVDIAADSASMLDRLDRADRVMSIRKTSFGVVAAAAVMVAGVAYLTGQGGTNDQLVVQESPPSSTQHTTTSRPSATTISVPPVTSAPADTGGTGTTALESPDDQQPTPGAETPGVTTSSTSPTSTALLPGQPLPTVPPPTTTTTTAQPHRCTGGAYLQYAYATAMPFTNTFSGNAVPGTVVTFTSAYVSGATTADVSGKYQITAEISGLTKGQTVNIYANCQGNTVYWPFEYR